MKLQSLFLLLFFLMITPRVKGQSVIKNVYSRCYLSAHAKGKLNEQRQTIFLGYTVQNHKIAFRHIDTNNLEFLPNLYATRFLSLPELPEYADVLNQTQAKGLPMAAWKVGETVANPLIAVFRTPDASVIDQLLTLFEVQYQQEDLSSVKSIDYNPDGTIYSVTEGLNTISLTHSFFINLNTNEVFEALGLHTEVIFDFKYDAEQEPEYQIKLVSKCNSIGN